MTIIQQLNEELIEQANKSAKLIANQKVVIFDYKNQIKALRSENAELFRNNVIIARDCSELIDENKRLIEELSNMTIKHSELENKLNNKIG